MVGYMGIFRRFYQSLTHMNRIFLKSERYKQIFEKVKNLNISEQSEKSVFFKSQTKEQKFVFQKVKSCENKYSLKNFCQDFLLSDLLSSKLSSSTIFSSAFLFIQEFFFIFYSARYFFFKIFS